MEIKCLLDIYIYIFFFFSNLLSLESKGKVIFFCIGCICVSQIKDTLFSCWDGFLVLRCRGSKSLDHPALDPNPRARSCDGPTPPPVKEASGGENLRALEVRSQLWKLRPPDAYVCATSQKPRAEVKGLLEGACSARCESPRPSVVAFKVCRQTNSRTFVWALKSALVFL